MRAHLRFVFRGLIMVIIRRIISLPITVLLGMAVFIHLIAGVQTMVVVIVIALRWLWVIRIVHIIVTIWVIMDVRLQIGVFMSWRRLHLGFVVFLVRWPLSWGFRQL
jgi:hypothetical protein